MDFGHADCDVSYCDKTGYKYCNNTLRNDNLIYLIMLQWQHYANARV